MTEPADLSAAELAERIRGGDEGALRVTRSCLGRIQALDPQVRAFLTVNDRAQEEAWRLDRCRGQAPPATLDGVPVAVKDNILTRDLRTTCGSRILERFAPAGDATAVERLRAAGAVILGKTNLDEFGMGSSTENSAFGATRNPWDLGRVAGGSSGGSAAAVAAGMVPLALGSDTGGSVRQPAAFCGVVGLKPTYGRVSRFGLVAYGSSLDQIGPLGRTVRDVALVLTVIEGADPADATSSPVPGRDYVAACEDGVNGMRIGLPREYLGEGLDPEIERAVLGAAGRLEQHGAGTEEVSLPHTPYAISTYYLLATAEASSNLSRFDGVRYGLRAGDTGDLESLYRTTRGMGFGAEVKRRIMLGTYALSAGYRDAFYNTAQRARSVIRRDFSQVFGSGVDLLLTATTPTVAFRLGEKLDDPLAMYLSDVYTVTSSLAGLPALSVPVGLSAEGLPIGAQLIGPPFGEDRLFRAGAVIASMFGSPRPPLLPARPAGTGSG
jgi:aspartyl-tRNA(Asn)/glutamyl-tRNA(Gln) amidotransferase subunit A